MSEKTQFGAALPSRPPLLHEELTRQIISAAIDVHRELGPGLLESAYQACLLHELLLREIPCESEVPLPVRYKAMRLDCGYRIDFVIAKSVAVELKSVEKILPIHHSQLMTYLRLSGLRVGLLMNFNVEVLRQGIIRKVI
jgi:GxxExxY protein